MSKVEATCDPFELINRILKKGALGDTKSLNFKRKHMLVGVHFQRQKTNIATFFLETLH